MRSGTLPASTYRRYLAQDIVFLCAYVTAVSIAMHHPSMAKRLGHFLSEALRQAIAQLDLVQVEAKARGIDPGSFKVFPATMHFGKFLIRIAQRGRADQILASLVPCVRLYAYIGQNLVRLLRANSKNPYRGWIEKYASPEMEAIARHWESMLSQHGRFTTGVRRTYRTALKHELAFFQAAYLGK
jgi:thiaminase/transcriptional activator TenA